MVPANRLQVSSDTSGQSALHQSQPRLGGEKAFYAGRGANMAQCLQGAVLTKAHQCLMSHCTRQWMFMQGTGC